MTDSTYPAGSIKYDPASGALAIRTMFEEPGDFAHMAWLVAKSNGSATHADSAKVAGWADDFQVVNGQVVLPD